MTPNQQFWLELLKELIHLLTILAALACHPPEWLTKKKETTPCGPDSLPSSKG
jgi:hypothetical protein